MDSKADILHNLYTPFSRVKEYTNCGRRTVARLSHTPD